MRFCTPLVVALAALVAVPAAAATRTKKTTAAATKKTTAVAAPRMPSDDPAPRTTSTAAGAPASRALSVGGTVGAELGDLDGFALRVDGEMAIKQLTPKVLLSGVGSVGFSTLSADVLGIKTSWSIFKVIPAARFTLPVAPQFSLYGDAGLGLYYGRFTSKWSLLGVNYELADSNVGLMMRIGAGAFYELNPKMKLSAEISLLPYFGDVDTTTWTLGVGAMFLI